MDPRVAARMSAQRGLILRRQVLEVGVSADELRLLLRSGEWVAVRRGVYTTRSRWEQLDEYRGRPLMEAWAASLNMVMPHVLSHDSAAYAWDMPILMANPRLVHITRFGVQGGRTTHGVKHHLAPHTPDEIDFAEDVPTLCRARTAVDIAREHGLRHGVVACDSAMRAGVSRRDLERVTEAMTCWPGITVARRSVRLADPGAETVGESLTRLLVLGLGLGPVETQFGLTDGRRTVWCDLRLNRHIIEFDGRLKYRTPADGGVAERPPDEVVWQEKQRQDFVCGFKLGMSRVVWRDLLPQHWELTCERVRREIVDTNARFGVSIEDLAPYVVRRR